MFSAGHAGQQHRIARVTHAALAGIQFLSPGRDRYFSLHVWSCALVALFLNDLA